MVLAMSQISAADPVGGSKNTIERVDAHGTDVYRVRLWEDEVTAITVSGDGDTDLDLFVYDENGNLVASDTDGTDRCRVHITPRWTGQFRIEVENLGSVYNEYEIQVW